MAKVKWLAYGERVLYEEETPIAPPKGETNCRIVLRHAGTDWYVLSTSKIIQKDNKREIVLCAADIGAEGIKKIRDELNKLLI